MSKPCNGSADSFARPCQRLTSGNILRGIPPNEVFSVRSDQAKNGVRRIKRPSKNAPWYASSFVCTTVTKIEYHWLS